MLVAGFFGFLYTKTISIDKLDEQLDKVVARQEVLIEEIGSIRAQIERLHVKDDHEESISADELKAATEQVQQQVDKAVARRQFIK